MLRLTVAACLSAVLLACTTAHAQTDTQMQKLRYRLGLPGDAKLSLLDSKGKPISYDDFMRQVRTHGSSITRNPATHSTVLSINSASQIATLDTLSLKIKPGDALPAFDLRTTQGQRVTNADLAGHYTLLSFYFADCSPCIAEVPTLNALAKQHTDFKLLTVTYDSRNAAQVFAKQRGLHAPSLAGAKTWIDALGVSTYPALLLVDPQGRLAAATVSTALATPATHGIPTTTEISQWVDRHRAR